jgi:hypothetical protein
MQSRTDKTTAAALRAMLMLTTIGGMASILLARWSHGASYLSDALIPVLVSYCAFVWYCRDSDKWRYRRSLWRNILFNGFALLFVPWYLATTRPPGYRLRAVLRMICFLLVMLAARGAGLAVGMIVIKLGLS